MRDWRPAPTLEQVGADHGWSTFIIPQGRARLLGLAAAAVWGSIPSDPYVSGVGWQTAVSASAHISGATAAQIWRCLMSHPARWRHTTRPADHPRDRRAAWIHLFAPALRALPLDAGLVDALDASTPRRASEPESTAPSFPEPAPSVAQGVAAC